MAHYLKPSTSRRAGRCAPRRPSTTPTTSASGAGSPGGTGRRCLRSDRRPTSACSVPKLEACSCAPDARTLERVVLPSKEDGLPAPGLRFGEPRVLAVLSCLCAFAHLFEGLTNRSLRGLVPGLVPGYGSRQMTYNLRRLRRKGLIRRIPRSQRYDARGPAARRLLHEDLNADRQPLARRARPLATGGPRAPHATWPTVAGARARPRDQHRGRCPHGLKR